MGVDNPNAFPSYSPDESPFNHGMTLRDWFAGQVIAQIVLADLTSGESAAGPMHRVAGAYAIADAMLAERAKGQG